MSALNKYTAKIAPEDRRALSREIVVEAHNKAEAQEMIEGMYPTYYIYWIK